MFFRSARTVVLGGGDLASGVIYRLHRAGFPVMVTELPSPLFVRRAVSFGEAVYSGDVRVDGVRAQHVESLLAAQQTIAKGNVPVVVDPDGLIWQAFQPVVVVDARMEKRNLGLHRGDAPLVIGLGPGFYAGKDVHAVVETNRGHRLGRVIWQGAAEPDTGQPRPVRGRQQSRVLRAPVAGHVRARVQIGQAVREGAVIAIVENEPVRAAFDGVLRGIIHERVHVRAGLKIGDLDPRGEREMCFTISDKALSVGGGVLEAVLSSVAVRERVQI